MHTTKDYAGSPTKAFDAVEDIKAWFGVKKWKEVSPAMAKITSRNHFEFYASLGGISGYPVKAWYELYHGQDSWESGAAEEVDDEV